MGEASFAEIRERVQKSIQFGFVEVKSLFTSIRTSTDLPCEVTAYDWSCNQRTIVLVFWRSGFT